MAFKVVSAGAYVATIWVQAGVLGRRGWGGSAEWNVSEEEDCRVQREMWDEQDNNSQIVISYLSLRSFLCFEDDTGAVRNTSILGLR